MIIMAEPTNTLTIFPPKEREVSTFEKELEHLINKHSMENGSDTPDFILAEYLVNQLEVFNRTIKRRTIWKS